MQGRAVQFATFHRTALTVQIVVVQFVVQFAEMFAVCIPVCSASQCNALLAAQAEGACKMENPSRQSD